MATHKLVCIRAFTVPAQTLAPMRITSLVTGADMGTVGESITLPEQRYEVGYRTTCSRKPEALKMIKTGNWEYAH